MTTINIVQGNSVPRPEDMNCFLLLSQFHMGFISQLVNRPGTFWPPGISSSYYLHLSFFSLRALCNFPFITPFLPSIFISGLRIFPWKTYQPTGLIWYFHPNSELPEVSVHCYTYRKQGSPFLPKDMVRNTTCSHLNEAINATFVIYLWRI